MHINAAWSPWPSLVPIKVPLSNSPMPSQEGRGGAVSCGHQSETVACHVLQKHSSRGGQGRAKTPRRGVSDGPPKLGRSRGAPLGTRRPCRRLRQGSPSLHHRPLTLPRLLSRGRDPRRLGNHGPFGGTVTKDPTAENSHKVRGFLVGTHLTLADRGQKSSQGNKNKN